MGRGSSRGPEFAETVQALSTSLADISKKWSTGDHEEALDWWWVPPSRKREWFRNTRIEASSPSRTTRGRVEAKGRETDLRSQETR